MAIASTLGSQRANRLTSGVSAKATTVARISISTVCVRWLSSQPTSRTTASQARMTSGTSTARRSLDSGVTVIMAGPRRRLPRLSRLSRLVTREEEIGDQQDEEAIFDDHVAAERLLDRVPDDPAVHVPEEEQQDRESPLQKVKVDAHGPGEEEHQLGHEERIQQRSARRHRRPEHTEGAVAGQ